MLVRTLLFRTLLFPYSNGQAIDIGFTVVVNNMQQAEQAPQVHDAISQIYSLYLTAGPPRLRAKRMW
jgi:hypothetical protein